MDESERKSVRERGLGWLELHQVPSACHVSFSFVGTVEKAANTTNTTSYVPIRGAL